MRRPLFRFPEPGEPPWRIAHRGGAGLGPENTLAAALLGHAAGAEAWELDVQLSRDGVPVVIHDESLRRTTDAADRFADDPRSASGLLVADFDLAEIRALTPGVPTLEEALDLTRSLGWRVNVELKSVPSAPIGLAEAVLELLERHDAHTWAWVSSFDHAEAAAVARARPTLGVGVLAATPVERPAEYVRGWVGADAYHPSTAALGAESLGYGRAPSPATLRRADLDGLRAAGVPFFAYTVDDRGPGGIADDLSAAGAAGWFTDHVGQSSSRRAHQIPQT